MGYMSHFDINTPYSFSHTHTFTSSKLLLSAICFPNWQVVQLFSREKERAGEEAESSFEAWDITVWVEVQNCRFIMTRRMFVDL